MCSVNSSIGERKSEFKLDLSSLICNTQILITSLFFFGLLWSKNEVSMEVVCRLPQSTQNRHCYEVKTETIRSVRRKGLLGLRSRGEDPHDQINCTRKNTTVSASFFPGPAYRSRPCHNTKVSELSDCIGEPDFLSLIHISPLWTTVG